MTILVAELQAEQEELSRTLDLQIAESHQYNELVVIQAESLDYNVIDHRRKGVVITPFLNRLRKDALFLKLDPHHYGGCGSSGADFQLLTGKLPLKNYPIYRICGVDYNDALPNHFARKGVRSYAYHGHMGSFFNRDDIFSRMGFTRFFDMADYSDDDSRHGISDRLFFEESSAYMVDAPDSKNFHFLITLSSHGPFNLVDHAVISGETRVERFLNSINYLDGEIEEFVSGIEGPSLLLIYGDHSSGVRDETYDSLENGLEFSAAYLCIVKHGVPAMPELLQEKTSDLTHGVYTIASLNAFIRNDAWIDLQREEPPPSSSSIAPASIPFPEKEPPDIHFPMSIAGLPAPGMKSPESGSVNIGSPDTEFEGYQGSISSTGGYPYVLKYRLLYPSTPSVLPQTSSR